MCVHARAAPCVHHAVLSNMSLIMCFKPPRHFLSLGWVLQDFIGGSPSFEAVDGSGLAVGAKVATTDATAPRTGDGGVGSVGDVLLSVKGRGSFRYMLCIDKPCCTCRTHGPLSALV